MRLRLTLRGHPLHPAVVHFPIAFWIVGAASDLAGWLSGESFWWGLSFAGQALGSVLAVPAMIAGAIDFRNVPADQAACDIAVWHVLAMISAWLLYLVSLAPRWPPVGPPPSWASMAALVGFAAVILGGWFGGHLVYRFGVGTRLPVVHHRDR